jgi:hypothetical protein
MFAFIKKGEAMFSPKQSVAGFGKMLVSSAFAALLVVGSAGTVQANGCGQFHGSWLVTVTNSDGSFGSRQVLTLSADHTAFIIDSNQGGVTGPGGYNSYTSEQGSWSCTGSSATATLINFTLPGPFPGPQQIARIDYTISASAPQTISGPLTLRYYALTDNPVEPVPPSSTSTYNYTFTAILIQ